MKTRIAVAGAGYIGRAHMAAAQASTSCTLSVLADPFPGAGAVDAAASAGVPRYRSLTQLLAADRPEGVIVATLNFLKVIHENTHAARH